MRLTSALLAVAAFIGMMSASTAQAADAQGTANATVIAPLAITAGEAMNFGTITPPTTGDGTVSSDGTAPTGGATQTGTFNNQTFAITGEGSSAYNNTGSDPSVTLTGPGAATLTAALTYTSANSFVLAAGSDTLTATGVLTVPSTATAGTYTGNYNVVVNYN